MGHESKIFHIDFDFKFIKFQSKNFKLFPDIIWSLSVPFEYEEDEDV